ncbi:hypothetical protein F3157_22340 [Virgibacillus dakarensis]|nr:hypothetical protein [Virgibacillus dakarensis]
MNIVPFSNNYKLFQLFYCIMERTGNAGWASLKLHREASLIGGFYPLGKGLKQLIPIEKAIELMLMFSTLILLVVNSREKK